MPFGLKTYGEMRLTGLDGQPATFPDKGLIAIVFLGFRPSGRVSRAELASFLWGEGEDGGTKALGNLRQLLSRVRIRQRELGTTFLDIESADIVLCRDDIRFDFEDMQPQHVQDSVARLDVFLRNMSGQFLADYDIPSETGQLWLLERRDFWLPSSPPRWKRRQAFYRVRTPLRSRPPPRGSSSSIPIAMSPTRF